MFPVFDAEALDTLFHPDVLIHAEVLLSGQ